ncbi:Transthyretin-like family protein [Oesophagostomum dentatum]|uniref:Transthyretin-like family protein n=1 Tax=Oesophagostomum dentatum TaxID=61180 RepID=A0A0B1TDD6_OESDE|nr:Transthyretin-like family protein [Oesophagostomum dentatum]
MDDACPQREAKVTAVRKLEEAFTVQMKASAEKTTFNVMEEGRGRRQLRVMASTSEPRGLGRLKLAIVCGEEIPEFERYRFHLPEPCSRKIKFVIPKKFIHNGNPTPEQWIDIGVINLEGAFDDEKRECVN